MLTSQHPGTPEIGAKVVPADLLGPVPTFNIITCNLNGLNGNGHLVAGRLKTPTPCVLFQETKFNNAKQLDTFHRHLTNEVGDGLYQLFTNDHRALRTDTSDHRRCGVASYFHSSMPGYGDLHHLAYLDHPDRYMVVRTLWSGVPVYFHNVYAPVLPQLRRGFFDSLPRDFEPDSIHLVGGDFNLPFDGDLDTSRPRPDHSSGKTECVAWLTALRVVDGWRSHHPTERLYSGPGRVNRLDYIFLDSELMAHFYQNASYVKNDFGGDHLCHSLHLSKVAPTTTGGYWRLPRELLANSNIVNAIKVEAGLLLDKMVSDPTQNYGAMWYGWLKRMKKRLQQCHRHHLEMLNSTLHCLQLKVSATQRYYEWSGLGAADVEVARKSLEDAKVEHSQHLQDQQFDFHANSNERGSSHFFRRPQGSKIPISTANVDGVAVTDSTTVQAVFTAHWKSIMVAPMGQPPLNRARRRAVIRMLSKRLTSDQRADLDRPLTANELCSALKTMNPKKSPGPDGWSAGFFQVDPVIFSEILLLVFNYQLVHQGRLLPQQRESAVALLFKAGDRGDPGNYRPIALMAVEVKVLSRALAYRLAQYAPQLIHPTQAGFVPGRRLHDHVLTIQAMQQYCTMEDHDHYATFLDFSKAYDMVDQDFLFDVLGEMNIGSTFISWVKMLYCSPMVQIIFNGALGPTIKPTRGVKQGCPLSCLLFVLYLEPLGDMLRDQPHLGVTLPHGDTVTSIFFADDSTLLSQSLEAAVEQMAIVQEFCDVSGAKLNQSKCMTLVLNGHLDPGDIDDGGLLNVLATGQPVKYLGVLFGHALPLHHQVTHLNDKFLACFQQWGCRARTLQGRKLLVNTVMLSLLWHVTTVLPVPEPMVQGWQSMLNKYVLARKTDPTARYRPLLQRKWQYDRTLGLGLPHIASKLRGQRLQRLQHLMAGSSATSPPWQPLVLRQFSRTLGKLHRATHPFDFLFYYPNTSSKWLCLWELHPLWRDVWAQWAATPMAMRIQVEPNLATVMAMPVWLTQYDLMRTSDHHCAANLAKCPPTRRWCRNGASNGFFSLQDFVNIDGAWPSRGSFMSNMSNGNSASQVEVGPTGVMQLATVHRTVPTYLHLTRVHQKVTGLYRNDAIAIRAAPAAPHPFVALVKDKPRPFQAWPKGHVTKLAYHAPAVDCSHPMATTTRTTDTALKRYVYLVRRTCRVPPPVQGDVWLRLLYRMLPVNSRFYYLQPTQTTAVCCAYGCGAIETEHHAFHQCHHVYPVWLFHAKAWRCYGVNFSWSTISNLDLFYVNQRGAPMKDAVFLIWSLLTASTLYTIWTQHNAVQYDNKNPLPSTAWEELTFLGWTASLRRWLRLQDPDSCDRVAVLDVLGILKSQPNYRVLWTKYPRCLAL